MNVLWGIFCDKYNTAIQTGEVKDTAINQIHREIFHHNYDLIERLYETIAETIVELKRDSSQDPLKIAGREALNEHFSKNLPVVIDEGDGMMLLYKDGTTAPYNNSPDQS